MNYLIRGFIITIFSFCFTNGDQQCNIECPARNQPLVCGFDPKGKVFKMFPSSCAIKAYKQCYGIEYQDTPIDFCIKHHNRMLMSRKMYGESCPVFCPSHWRPVCGVSTYRGYRTFNNGCYLDMINCRGEFDDNYYTEVPLEYCPKHGMKNIYKEQVLISGLSNLRDYD